MSLKAYGWNDTRAEYWEKNAPPGTIPARVISEHRDRYRIHTEKGDLTARLSGRSNHQASEAEDYPTVGDWVAVTPDPSGDQAIIQRILPRQSKFSRKTVGKKTEEQVIAANLDTVWIVTSFDFDLNPARLERYVTMVSESGSQPVVILAKADLVPDPETVVTDLAGRMSSVPIIASSTKTRGGLEPLKKLLSPGTTIALLGSSGVGKSSLINHLAGREVMSTAPVREKDGKGRHTTTHRELILLPDGTLLLDTPGMRELQLWGPEESLEKSFSDIEALASECRFSNCNHESEPGCAIITAQEKGLLSPERVNSFRKLRQELAELDQKKTVRPTRRTKYSKPPREPRS